MFLKERMAVYEHGDTVIEDGIWYYKFYECDFKEADTSNPKGEWGGI